MKRSSVLSLILAGTLAFAGTAFAQKACSPADEANASKAADRVSSWSALQSSWKAYRHCDKGAVADLFTEALLRLIVDWKQVEQLAAAMKADPDYEDFVISHLKSPAAKNDSEDVFSRAKMNCPKGQAPFCSLIAEAVDPTPPKPIQLEPMPAIAPSAPAAAPAPAKK